MALARIQTPVWDFLASRVGRRNICVCKFPSQRCFVTVTELYENRTLGKQVHGSVGLGPGWGVSVHIPGMSVAGPGISEEGADHRILVSSRVVIYHM